VPDVGVERFFEVVLLADQSLVQAGWVGLADVGAREPAAKLLASGPTGRADLPLPGVSLKWTFEPQLGITTAFTGARMTLLSVLLGSPASPREGEMLGLWVSMLRSAPPVKQLNGDDPEAFEIFRRVRDRPLAASVLLPEGSREECKALVDFHRGVAAALFTAKWSDR
jgi:hypothetical protein